MVFSDDDRVLIRELRISLGYSARRLLKEFPHKKWSLAALNRLIKNITVTGSARRKQGSGRPRNVRLQRLFLRHCGRHTVQISILSTTKSGACCRIECTGRGSETLIISVSDCWRSGVGLTNGSSTVRSVSGANGFSVV